MPKIVAGYDEKEKSSTIITDFGPTKTKQALAEQLDVNKIVRKYGGVDQVAAAHSFEAVYGVDFNSIDIHQAIDMLDRASELFESVPSEIRAKFDNDAGKYIDFATNPQNLEQMRAWGMTNLPPVEPASPPAGGEPPPEPAPKDGELTE